MQFLKLILIIFSINTVAAPPEKNTWVMTSQLEPIKQSKRQVLTWQKGKRKQIYRPTDLPFGMVRSKEFQFGKQVFWMTMWPYNGQSVVYRVFSPEIKNTPLCEVHSYSDSSELKIEKKKLLISVYPNEPTVPSKGKKEKEVWVPCRKL